MKRFILFLIFVFMIIAGIITTRIFSNDRKTNEKTETVQQSVENEEDSEEKTEETIIINNETEPDTDISNEEGRPVYKMLDFDRRLILNVGVQDDYACSIYCLAYARAILDDDYEVDPYAYWDDGAVWSVADFGDIAGNDSLDTVLKRAYDKIDEGKPTIIYTSGTYATTLNENVQERKASEHFVLLIGYRADADYNDLKPSDFYGVDPSGGYYMSEENNVPWVILSDSAPELMLGEYALFAPVDDKSVKTCLAYPDSVRWNFDRLSAVYPEYIKQ